MQTERMGWFRPEKNRGFKNRALVARLGWEMMKQKDSLWVIALGEKYCRGTNLLGARMHHGASWIW